MEMNMYEYIRGRKNFLPEDKVRGFVFQLLKSIDHMHRNNIFHRDIKPENILITEDTIKLADFGSCKGIYSKHPYTEYISTRWYRSPECLLTDGYYDYKMDLWGVGCVFYEIMALNPLFPGSNELDQVHRIHKILGTPPSEVLAEFEKKATHMKFDFPEVEGSGLEKGIMHVSPLGRDLISKLLTYRSDIRISARQALNHVYFKDIVERKKVFKVSPSPVVRNEETNDDYYEKKDMALPSLKKIKEYKNKIQTLSSNKFGKHSKKKFSNMVIENQVKFPKIKQEYYKSN